MSKIENTHFTMEHIVRPFAANKEPKAMKFEPFVEDSVGRTLES